MTATTASDPSGVQYFFDCTAGAGEHDSGWQSSSTYQDTVLTASTQYTYRVQTRDSLANTGGWSTSLSATKDAGTDPSLLAWWKFNKTSSTTAADAGTVANNGTRNGRRGPLDT